MGHRFHSFHSLTPIDEAYREPLTRSPSRQQPSPPLRCITLRFMLLRCALPADIPHIAALERSPIASEFVGHWSEERHQATLASSDARYLVADAPGGGLRAFAILRGLQETSGSIELKRIVIATPGQGLGRHILQELLDIAFQRLGAHRLFLDVFEDNPRALHVYRSLGFVHEGTMREAARRGSAFASLHLMSLLDREYAARPR